MPAPGCLSCRPFVGRSWYFELVSELWSAWAANRRKVALGREGVDAAGGVEVKVMQPQDWEEWYCRICGAAWVIGPRTTLWEPECWCSPECGCGTEEDYCDYYDRSDEIGEDGGWLPKSRIRNTITVRKPGVAR